MPLNSPRDLGNAGCDVRIGAGLTGSQWKTESGLFCPTFRRGEFDLAGEVSELLAFLDGGVELPPEERSKMPSRLEVFFLALMEELTEMPLTGTQPGPSSPLLFLRPTPVRFTEASPLSQVPSVVVWVNLAPPLVCFRMEFRHAGEFGCNFITFPEKSSGTAVVLQVLFHWEESFMWLLLPERCSPKLRGEDAVRCDP